jgi:hypothetical protein
VSVGSGLLPRGTQRQAFVHETFRLGESSFCISPLISGKDSNGYNRFEGGLLIEKVRNKQDKESTNIRLDVISGPYKGKSFMLQQGTNEVFVFGSTPSCCLPSRGVAQPATTTLELDSEIEKHHARIELVATKKLAKVKVMDLSSSGTYQ